MYQESKGAECEPLHNMSWVRFILLFAGVDALWPLTYVLWYCHDALREYSASQPCQLFKFAWVAATP